MSKLKGHPETIDAILIIAKDLVDMEKRVGGDLPYGLAIFEAKAILRQLMVRSTEQFMASYITVRR